MYKFLLIIPLLLVLVLSCSSEKSADIVSKKLETGSETTHEQSQTFASSKSGSYSLTIIPGNATVNSALQVIAQGFKLSDTKIEWLLNGHPALSHSVSQFDARRPRKVTRYRSRQLYKVKN
jgi:hypothetical protein